MKTVQADHVRYLNQVKELWRQDTVTTSFYLFLLIRKILCSFFKLM